MQSPPLWTLPSTIRWWAPARATDGQPCADDVQTALLVHRWMARNEPLGSLEAVWVASPPRARTRASARSGLARRTDGRPGEVVCRLGVRVGGVTARGLEASVDAFEDAIGTIFEVGSHDARRSDDPDLPTLVHPVEVLMAPTGAPGTAERLAELPEHLARMAIRAGRLALQVRVSPMTDSAHVLPELDEAHRATLARDRHRYRAPRGATILRSRVLRDLGDTVLLRMALRAERPLDAATRLAFEQMLADALGAPVAVRDASDDARPIPADGEFASMLMGIALHAFSGARRPSAARLRQMDEDYAPARRRRRMREATPLAEDEEG
jgi:hypothetical protein